MLPNWILFMGLYKSIRGFTLTFFLLSGFICFVPSSMADSHKCYSAMLATPDHPKISRALMWSLAQVESGRGKGARPWPWTINVDGRGYYFKDRDSAARYIARLRGAGVRSFDVGCWQINARWHGHRVRDAVHLLDPDVNSKVAFAYLSELTTQHSELWHAVAAYHAPSDKPRGDAYVERLLAIR